MFSYGCILGVVLVTSQLRINLVDIGAMGNVTGIALANFFEFLCGWYALGSFLSDRVAFDVNGCCYAGARQGQMLDMGLALEHSAESRRIDVFNGSRG